MKKNYIGVIGFMCILLVTSALHNWVALVAALLTPLFIKLSESEE